MTSTIEDQPIAISEDLTFSEDDAEVKYKATLAVVTKKRKKYPKELAKSLGYTMRLEKNAIEAMKVNLPPHNPLEEHEDSCLYDEQSFDDLNFSLEKLMEDIQELNSKLQKITSATSILKQNPTDPFNDLMEALSNI